MPNEAEGSVVTGNPEAVEGSWTAGLEEYQEVIDAKGWQSNSDVLKSYVNLERQIGADKVVLPGEGTDLTEWEGWKQLGTPDSADDYQLTAPEGFNEYNIGLSDWFRSAAHEMKLPATIAQGLHDRFVENAIEAAKEQKMFADQQQEKWLTELKKDFGTAFDERTAAAKSAIREFGTPELRDLMESSGLGDHPEIVKAFVKIGMALGTGPQFKDAESSGQFGTTPEIAKEKIAKIRANPATYDKQHPEHNVLNSTLTQLYEIAYGTDVVGNAG